VAQIQDVNQYTSLFKMPVVFEVHYKDGSAQSKKFWVENYAQDFVIANSSNKEVDYVLFDPNAQIPKKIIFTKSEEMLLAQAQKALYMIDRYDALVELRNVNIEKKRNLLIAQFQKEKFHGIKAEILAQLVYDENKNSKEIIKLAFTNKSTDVKKALIAKLPSIPLEFKTNYESFLQDSSYDIIASSLEKLCNEFPNEIEKYLALTKDVIGVRNRNVELKWIEMSLTQKGSQDLFNKLVNYSSNSYEFQTRINAMAVLKKFNYFDAYLMDHCFDAIFNPNSRLAGPALDALKHFKAQYTFKQMIEERMAALSTDEYQKEIIKKNFY
jgi:aminopeptidase N